MEPTISQSPQTQIQALPQKWQDAIRREMHSGERIVWMDQPNPKQALISSIPVFFFAIFWAGFAFFWEAMALGIWQKGDSSKEFDMIAIVFPLFGLPFCLIGIGLLLSPLWMYLGAKRCFYFITDQRVVLMTFARSIGIKTYMPGMLESQQKILRPDGSGDVFFISEMKQSKRGEYESKVGFKGIKQPEMAVKYLEALKANFPA